jgi:hypothetical protein
MIAGTDGGVQSWVNDSRERRDASYEQRDESTLAERDVVESASRFAGLA